jgi:two-component system, LytTR family, response regulator
VEKQLTVLIAEDMAEYLETIALAVKKTSPEIRIVGKATTLAETELLINKHSPDIVLLDIAFEEEGRTSFDLLHRLKENNRLHFHIIFITAHFESQYYSKAFDYKAVHFIEKPIDMGKLSEAIQRIKELEKRNATLSIEQKMEQDINSLVLSKLNSRIIINGVRFDEVYDHKDVVWIEADGRNSIFHLNNGRQLPSSQNLGEIERELSAFSYFFRINRSEIVNLIHVERYSRKEKLLIVPGKTPNHYVAREKFEEFLQRVKNGFSG